MPLQPRAMPPRRAARGFVLALVLLLSLAWVTGAEEQSWEGNAAVVRKGEFGSEGLFAASDSFPKNTLLEVENPQNVKTVQVTVVERINGSGNVFLLLSEQAAAALGLSAAEVIRVKARVLLAAGTAGKNGSQDLTRSLDSDVNPAAALAGLSEPAATTTAAAAETPAETPAVAASEEPAAAAPAAPEAEAAPAAAPAAPALSAEDRRLQELASRLPQKQLFLPRRDSGAFALREEAPPETAPIAEAAAETPAEEPAVAETPALPPEQPVTQEAPVVEQAPLPAETAEELPLAEAAVAETEAAEETPGEEPPGLSLGAAATSAAEPLEWAAPAPSAPEAEEPVEQPTVALPAAETAPAQAPPPSTAVEAPPAPEAPPAVAAAPTAPSALVRRSFYLQLGAYSTRSLAEKLAREVSTYARFTVAVLPAASGSRQLYKVLIGPLNRDESGTLLYQFRARGFKDAFVHFVE